jgi:sec-independent protein translocase protein TatA
VVASSGLARSSGARLAPCCVESRTASVFNLGPTEILMTFALALILFGPEKLPELARMLAKVLRETRRASNELQATLRDTMSGLEGDHGPSVTDIKRIVQGLDPREILAESPARAQFASPPPTAVAADSHAAPVIAAVPVTTPLGAAMGGRRLPLDQMPSPFELATSLPAQAVPAVQASPAPIPVIASAEDVGLREEQRPPIEGTPASVHAPLGLPVGLPPAAGRHEAVVPTSPPEPASLGEASLPPST